MARAIDGDKLVENLRLIATCWSISPFVSKEKHNGAVDMLREVEREVKEAPTLTPPNEPLTLEQLREMNGEPVWVNSIRLWGIVRVYSYGIRVLTKSGEFDITRMKIYRRPPEGEA